MTRRVAAVASLGLFFLAAPVATATFVLAVALYLFALGALVLTLVAV